MSFIRIEGVQKVFTSRDGTKVEALRDIALEIDRGQFVSFVGPSGCGKTTMLKILGGLQQPTKGQTFIGGERIDGPRRGVGIVFQQPNLLPWRTILENVMMPIEVQGMDKAQGLRRGRQLLEMVGLEGFEKKYPFELSGGMQQRAGICRALVHDPDLLLMDEPFGALDALTRENMNVELQRIWLESGKTIVFVTHSISEAIFLSDIAAVFSPRPGYLMDVIHVETPRPRSLSDVGKEKAGEQMERVRELIGSMSHVD